MLLITLSLFLLWLLILYHHLLFPLILKQQMRKTCVASTQDQERTEQIPDEQLPTMAILIPAYNEARFITDKIRNLAQLDYPAERLFCVIACDGCSDGTAALARQAINDLDRPELNIKVLNFSQNRGKVAVLNEVIPSLHTQIVALSDTSALIAHDALRRAAAHFTENQVGVVAATYRLATPGNQGEDSYWQYQINIKRGEAAFGSPIGVHGALYFFKRSLFTPMPADTINDDFILPMRMVSQGYQAIYDPHIIALELEVASRDMDQRRRIRIAAGNFQQLLRLPMLLHPRLKGTAFCFASGKALRSLMPLILLLQWALCLLLGSEYSVLFWLALAQALLFLIAWRSTSLAESHFPRLVNVVFYIANGYRASLVGIIRYIAGLERGYWKPVSTGVSKNENK
jgi:cellulose synthase/poly-beta-1,6-N-acetylglucosamine synthase-like glycosyltransferase